MKECELLCRTLIAAICTGLAYALITVLLSQVKNLGEYFDIHAEKFVLAGLLLAIVGGTSYNLHTRSKTEVISCNEHKTTVACFVKEIVKHV